MTQPIFAAVLAVVMKQQKLTGILALGVALTFGGSIIMAKVRPAAAVLETRVLMIHWPNTAVFYNPALPVSSALGCCQSRRDAWPWCWC